MKERPILFKGDMVRAILEGRKTQTRRVVKAFKHLVPALGAELDCIKDVDGAPSRLDMAPDNWECCPYGQPGDRLWVRESFADESGGTRKFCGNHIYYRADAEGVDLQGGFWTPSIYMPRWASRITLEVTGVRVERLQDISEEDAVDEGVSPRDWRGDNMSPDRARKAFRRLWESINGPGSWDANPWVWMVEFQRVQQ